MYTMWNPSPTGAKVGDCAVRAVSKALGTDWGTAYTMLCVKGFEMADMPSATVWDGTRQCTTRRRTM